MSTKWDKKKFTSYMLWTFVISWILQVIGSVFANKGNQMVFSLLLSVAMYGPFLGVIMAKIPLKGMGGKPQFKGKIRYILAAWFLPAVLSILGAILYFVIFPDRLDLTGAYLTEVAGETVIEQLKAQGITVPMYLAISSIQAITYAPLDIMFVALGEEVGWRGAMMPMLKERLGKSKGRIVGGIIWGAWHWPIMILAGYEYGKDYFGAPFLGLALFCLFTTVGGILLDVVYEKTQCIWVPALAHGAINACSFVMYMVKPAYMDQLILGPMPIGIISMIPALLVAGWLLVKEKDNVHLW